MPSKFRQARAAIDAAATAVTRLLDGGALRLYSEPQPATADAAPAGRSILLAEVPFGTPAFGSARDGLATAHPLTAARAGGTGAPVWFRAISRDGRPIFDGSVGLEGSGADLELPVSSIQIGAEVVIASMTYRQPREA
jgi:hypothetical protein